MGDPLRKESTTRGRSLFHPRRHQTPPPEPMAGNLEESGALNNPPPPLGTSTKKILHCQQVDPCSTKRAAPPSTTPPLFTSREAPPRLESNRIAISVDSKIPAAVLCGADVLQLGVAVLRHLPAAPPKKTANGRPWPQTAPRCFCVSGLKWQVVWDV